MKARLAPQQHSPPAPASGFKQLDRWRRARSFACILAEVGPSGEGDLAGCVNVSMFQAAAALPAPFPSLAPWVPYVSSLAVSPDQRRKGVAKRLIDQCERIARLWGQQSIYLHVSGSNTSAISLYLKSGFVLLDPGPSFLPLQLRQMLMKKEIRPLAATCHELKQEPEEVKGLGDIIDKVFIWR